MNKLDIIQAFLWISKCSLESHHRPFRNHIPFRLQFVEWLYALSFYKPFLFRLLDQKSFLINDNFLPWIVDFYQSYPQHYLEVFPKKDGLGLHKKDYRICVKRKALRLYFHDEESTKSDVIESFFQKIQAMLHIFHSKVSRIPFHHLLQSNSNTYQFWKPFSKNFETVFPLGNSLLDLPVWCVAMWAYGRLLNFTRKPFMAAPKALECFYQNLFHEPRLSMINGMM